MWIFLSILALLAAIILFILLLPVKVIIKNDENEIFILRYKLLFKTFGENPNPDDTLVKTLKKAGGIDRFEKTAMKQNIRTDGLQKTVSDSYDSLIDLLKELLFLFKRCTVTRLKIKIISADEDPSEAAIHYGLYNAITHTFLAVANALLKIRKRGCDIDIRCDYSASKSLFRYEIVFSIPLARVLAAFWRVVMAEAKRTTGQAKDQAK